MQRISLDTFWAGCGIQHEWRPYHPDLHPQPSRFAGASADFVGSDILVFMNADDEFPLVDVLNAAYDVIDNERAQCASRYISVNFSPHGRSAWLDAENTNFLSELNHGGVPFWIQNGSTPIWGGNIAYDLRLFRDDPTLRFDRRYNLKDTDRQREHPNKATALALSMFTAASTAYESRPMDILQTYYSASVPVHAG